MVNITEARLKELERIESKMLALEAGGVDNWEWYGESLKDWNKENELDELIGNFIGEFCENYFEFTEVDFPAGLDAGANVTFNNEWDSFFEKLIRKFLTKYDELED